MCTLPVSFPPDLDYSLVSVDRVIARPFLEQVPSCRPSTATKILQRLRRYFSLPFGAALWECCTCYERTNLCRGADGHEYFDGALQALVHVRGKIQGDGRKFLDRFKSYFGSQIPQSPNEVHIYRLQPKSATKGEFFSSQTFVFESASQIANDERSRRSAAR